MTYPFYGYTSVGTIAGLSDEERYELNELWQCWTTKMRRNLIRKLYYDQKNCLEDLGIGIPPHMTDLNAVLGWPAKSVDTLARRCQLEQFTVPGSDGDDPLGIRKLWIDNDMDVVLPQTITSAFIHSCAFVFVTKGDVAAGEPEVLISTQSALFASGIWDSRLQRLKSAFAVTDFDERGRTTGFVLFLPNLTIRGKWDRNWDIRRYPHTLNRLPVEVLPYKPSVDRPFGCSRITRAVMGLSDSAFRTMVRMEGHAEFFSAPQRWAMGADESMFQDENGNALSQWQAIQGKLWAAPRDEDGNAIELGQFPSTAPTPHLDQLRGLASAFCGETDLPLSSLGIIHDNPASAEAIEAAERNLILEARYTMKTSLGPRLARVMKTALEIRDGSLPAPAENLGVRWAAPEFPLQSVSADAMSKIIGSLPYLAESEIPLEKLDWDEATIRRAMADKRKATTSMMTQLLRNPNGGVTNGTSVPSKPGESSGGGGTEQSVDASRPTNGR